MSTLLPLLVLVIISVVIVVYLYKQGKCERTTGHEDHSSIGRSPDDASQTSASPLPPTIIVVPQVPDSESQGPPVNTEPVTVTGVSRSGRTPRHQCVLRYSDGNIGCSVDDPANLPALDTTTSTYLHPLNNSFASETGQDERYIYIYIYICSCISIPFQGYPFMVTMQIGIISDILFYAS